jgi:hypothetical protein
MVFDHWCLRIILRVRYPNIISNATLRSRCNRIQPLAELIRDRRLKWFGHVLRKPAEDIAHRVLFAQPPNSWRRRRGGQILIWSDCVKKDLEFSLGPTIYGVQRWNREWLDIAKELAQSRSAWRAMTRDIIGARPALMGET